MPITRVYQCGDCFHRLTVVLPLEDWERPPPPCPVCAQNDAEAAAQPMQQEFKVNIGGSTRARAVALAERIADEDYGVADMKIEGRQGERNKVRYKDQGTPAQATQVASWGATGDVMKTAMAIGRETRLKHGDGLDVLQSALRSGAQPDLIEVSKRNMMLVK